MKAQKKWQVEIHQKGYFNGLFQVWNKDGNAPTPAQEKKLRRLIEQALNK